MIRLGLISCKVELTELASQCPDPASPTSMQWIIGSWNADGCDVMATTCFGPQVTQHCSGKNNVLRALSCSPNRLSPCLQHSLPSRFGKNCKVACRLKGVIIRICRNFQVKFPGGLRRLLISTAGDRGICPPITTPRARWSWGYLHPIGRACGFNSHQTRWIPNFGFNAWCSIGLCISRAVHRVSCHVKLCTFAVAFTTSTFGASGPRNPVYVVFLWRLPTAAAPMPSAPRRGRATIITSTPS